MVPSVTFAQVPAPLTLQDWQAGQLDVMQQTPSTQLPRVHSWFELQPTLSPFLGMQDPPGPVQ
jgi:hypothetical protein